MTNHNNKERENDFEDFLQEKHAKNYQGIKDDIYDDFNGWSSELEVDDFVQYANEYAKSVKEKERQRIEKEREV